jgi:hypothetical protein
MLEITLLSGELSESQGLSDVQTIWGRGGDEKFFESMPIYARIGMHLLFYGKEQVKFLEGSKTVEAKLREQSISVCVFFAEIQHVLMHSPYSKERNLMTQHLSVTSHHL